jgi:hypothetical protein
MGRLPDMFLRGAEDAGGRFLLPIAGLCSSRDRHSMMVAVPKPYASKPVKILVADATSEPRFI